MKKSDYFESGAQRPSLKIYAILKRERPAKSLLSSPKSLSWPPRKKSPAPLLQREERKEERHGGERL